MDWSTSNTAANSEVRFDRRNIIGEGGARYRMALRTPYTERSLFVPWSRGPHTNDLRELSQHAEAGGSGGARVLGPVTHSSTRTSRSRGELLTVTKRRRARTLVMS